MESKRQRKEVDYYEHESVLPHNAHKTSDWTIEITNIMCIYVHDYDIFKLSDSSESKDIYLECISDEAWKGYIDIDNLPINDNYKTLVDEVKVVYDANRNVSEYFIDTYVYTFFTLMNFNKYPLSINAQHVIGTDIGITEEHVVSIPDFMIRSKKSKVLIVVEDKNASSSKFVNQWKENQVMGELFVAAHNMDISQPSEIYAIRIIGTLFTFYKAYVTPEYIKESAFGPPKDHCMDVHRFPNPGTNRIYVNALDFCKLEHRKVIVEYLSRIGNEMLK